MRDLYKAHPYCCTREEWINANYGIKLDDVPFMVCNSWEHAMKVHDILKKRHPSCNWRISIKTKGVY